MQTARLRQKTLDRIRANSAEVLPLRAHWTDRPDAPRIQYSAGRSGAALAVCTVAVMDDADPRREYYPSGFRKLAARYQERLLTTPPTPAPRPPTIYLRRETFLAIPTLRVLHNIWRDGDRVFATKQFSWDAVAYAVVIVDGRERIPKDVREVAWDWRYQAPVYFRLARVPKARALGMARKIVGHPDWGQVGSAARMADIMVWLLGGFPA